MVNDQPINNLAVFRIPPRACNFLQQFRSDLVVEWERAFWEPFQKKSHYSNIQFLSNIPLSGTQVKNQRFHF